MKITNAIRFLLIVLALVTVVALFACTDVPDANDTTAPHGNETTEQSGGETTKPKVDETTEPEGDETTEPEGGESTTSEPDDTEAPQCKHTNEVLDENCNLICADCKVILDTEQHVASAPDKDDNCNVKCTKCGKLLEPNQHAGTFVDAADHCNVKCTNCNAVFEENKHTTEGAEADPTDHCNVKCPVCKDVIGQEHSGDTFIDTDDGCRQKCSDCKDVVSVVSKHTIDEVNWTPVAGVGEDGKLYEEKICSACGQQADARAIKASGWLNKNSVSGSGGGIGNAFVLTDENNAAFKVGIYGWVAINGGVEKYVYRVIDENGNASEWNDVTVVVEIGDISQSEDHVNKINSDNLGLLNYASNSDFRKGIETPELLEYVNQTVTVEFAAIPANNKGSEDAPNTFTVATVENFKVTCHHRDNTNEYTFDPNDPQYIVSAECSVCKAENVKTLVIDSKEGLEYFNPEELKDKAGKGQVIVDANGLVFVRINAAKPEDSEESFWLYKNAEQALTGGSGYIAILHRGTCETNQLEVFVDSTNTSISFSKKSENFVGSANWMLTILDLSGSEKYDGQNIVALRFDHFNNGAGGRAADDYVDVAFISFFTSEEAAREYYVAYLDKYIGRDNCDHKYDGEWQKGTEEGTKKNTCIICMAEIEIVCEHTFDDTLWETVGENGEEKNCCLICEFELTRPCQHKGETFGDVENGCREKCSVCNEYVGENIKHYLEGVNWTPATGVGEDGRLYEEKYCSECGQLAEKRAIKASGWINSTVPSNATGAIGKVFTLTEGNNAAFKVSLYGWLAINGGVEKYVYRVIDDDGNASEWKDVIVIGQLGSTLTEGHLGLINSNNYGLVNYETNSNFTKGIETPELVEYVNQTVTVEFAAVPANNKGSEDAPNTFTVATVENFKVTCDHRGNTNVYTVDANDPQYVVCAECSVCQATGLKKLASESKENLVYFNPEEIKTQAGNGEIMTDTNGLVFVRIPAAKPADGEEFFWLYKNAEQALTGGSGYIAILHRGSCDKNYLQVYIDSVTASVSFNVKSPEYAGGEEWILTILNVSGSEKYDGENIVALRFDHFNNGANGRTEEDYVDIAFISFFTSEEAAYDYYKDYVTSYLKSEGCGHYNVNRDEWKAVEGKEGYIANYCTICDSPIILSVCQHSDASKHENATLITGDPIFNATVDCALCGSKGVKVVYEVRGGNYLFTPGKLALMATVQTVEFQANKRLFELIDFTVLKDADANGMPYIRYTLTAADNTEVALKLNSDTTNGLSGANKYFAILYRTESNPRVQLFINKTLGETYTGASSPRQNCVKDGEWNLLVFDLSEYLGDATTVSFIRLDIFDALDCPTGTVIDIAYAGFFATENDIDDYYGAYINEYIGNEKCTHKYTEWVAGENPGEKTRQCAICKQSFVEICEHDLDGAEWTKGDEEGTKKTTCPVCNLVIHETCEHDIDGAEWTKGDEEGTKKTTCPVCELVVQIACEHSYDDNAWVIYGERGEEKNTCLVCESEQTRPCQHKGGVTCQIDTTNGLSYKFICEVCNGETGISDENHVVLTPEELLGMASSMGAADDTNAANQNQPVANISSLTDPNYKDLPYLHVQVFNNTSKESYLYIKSPESIKGVGKYVAFIYRSNKVDASEMFITPKTWVAGTDKLKVDGFVTATTAWTYQLMDFSECATFDSESGVKTIRWDFNTANVKGHFLDVAYIGFFNSQAEAEVFCEAYTEEYNLDYCFKTNKDYCKIGGSSGTDYAGPANLGTSATMEFDFAGYTFEETPVIYFKGWFISSQGTVNYQYRYIVEGEEPVFGATFTGTSDTSGVGESGANTYGFDTSCGNGAKFTINALPLEGYEGKTVTLEIIANCVDGGEIVAVRFKNITIPAASVNE